MGVWAWGLYNRGRPRLETVPGCVIKTHKCPRKWAITSAPPPTHTPTPTHTHTHPPPPTWKLAQLEYLIWCILSESQLWRLTTGKNERVFLTCPCHKFYRVEAVGLKLILIPIMLKNFDFCEYVKYGAISWKNDTLSITWKVLLYICDTYYCDYLTHTTFHFNLIDFQLNTDFPAQFCVFHRKII